MATLLDPYFWLNFILFFIAVFFAFFIPGDIVIRKIKLSPFQRIIIATVVGMVLWGWQGFIFGYLGVRFLSYIYLLSGFFFWIKTIQKNFSFKFLNTVIRNKDYLLVMIISVGVFIQLSSVFFNGVLNNKGLYFCCGNLDDSILHTALTNQIIKNFPPFEPGMNEIVVRNYHYWGNLVIAELIRVFRLPLIPVQNQYTMFFISIFLGFTAIVFGQVLNFGKGFIRWFLFFLYFGGDLIFLLVSFMRKEINFNMSSLDDGAKFLVNPPRAFSVIVFFVGLGLFALWLKRKDLRIGIISIILLGSLIGFKVYTGLFALSGAGILAIYFLFKRDFKPTLLLLLIPLISLIIYLPVNSGAGGLYFTGFHLFENFIVQPWMMLERLEHARRIYVDHNNLIRIIQYEIEYIIIFIITIFGTKLVGLFQSKNSLNKLPKEMNVFFLGGILVSAILGFFFQQYSGGANTFNFLVSIFIFGSIYSALSMSYWLPKIRNDIKFPIIVLIVFLTIPRVIYETNINMSKIIRQKGFTIDNSELDGFKYLNIKTDKNSLILVDYRSLENDGRSPYISFLTDRPMYLSGMGNELSAHGIDFSERKKNIDIILKEPDGRKVANILKNNRINYIFLSYPYDLRTLDYLNFSRMVYRNKKITILEVSRDGLKKYLNND